MAPNDLKLYIWDSVLNVLELGLPKRHLHEFGFMFPRHDGSDLLLLHLYILFHRRLCSQDSRL